MTYLRGNHGRAMAVQDNAMVAHGNAMFIYGHGDAMTCDEAMS